MPRRGVNAVNSTPTRRSTNACERCKRRKIKCRISDEKNTTCVACLKSASDCLYIVIPDGIPRGAEYISALEAQIAELQDSLRDSQILVERLKSNGASTTSGVSSPGPPKSRGRSEPDVSPNHRHESLSVIEATVEDTAKNQHKVLEAPHDGVTNFTFLLHQAATVSQNDTTCMSSLPPANQADKLMNKAYYYTQSRHCLVDWNKVMSWHQQRQSLCYASESDDFDTQIAAFFVWVLYAIGAQLDQSTERSSKAYFLSASRYLPVVLSQQNLTAVQALLCLIQYYFRAPGGPSMWSLTGAAMRLCIELGLHKGNPSVMDPYDAELRKRFFWATYCFDRLISMISKRPFGIEDADISAELPIDVDVNCVDRDIIQRLQDQHVIGVNQYQTPTSITFALYHLSMYRLQSKIIAYVTRNRPEVSQFGEIQSLLDELDSRKLEASRASYPEEVPQQSRERADAIYYLTALLLMRHILMQPNIPSGLLERCASVAADACKNQRSLCFKEATDHSPIRVYQCFRCGMTLLQCLALNPNVLQLRRSMRAINWCSSALAVYTGTLSIARPYLHIFEKLSDHFLSYRDGQSLENSPGSFNARLQETISCEPSEIPVLWDRLSQNYEQEKEDPTSQMPSGRDEPMDDGPFVSNFGADLMPQFETLDDFLRSDAFQHDMVSLWHTSFTI